jgi:hypothetical protein
LSLLIALLLLLASLLHVPLLADCCVSPPSLASFRRRHQKYAFNTNVNVSISQQLATGHWSNESGGNAVMLTSRWRDKSGRWKAQQELE